MKGGQAYHEVSGQYHYFLWSYKGFSNNWVVGGGAVVGVVVGGVALVGVVNGGEVVGVW